MTDRELLELAAKAAGIVGTYSNGPFPGIIEPIIGGGDVPWNPLLNDGQALRLAVKLGINLEIGNIGFEDVQAGQKDQWACEWLGADDPYEATRRVIARVAAQIGRTMK